MNNETRVSPWNRWSVGRKIACIPLFFVAAIAGLITYAAIAVEDQLSDMVTAGIYNRQRMLIQRLLKETILESQKLPLRNEREETREIFEKSVQALLDGGPIVGTLAGEENVQENMLIPAAPTPQIQEALREQKRLLAEFNKQADAFLKLDRDAADYVTRLQDLQDLGWQIHLTAHRSRALFGAFSQQKLATMLTWEIVIAVAIGAAGLLFSWLLARRIVVPLGHVVGRAQNIAQGDLTGDRLSAGSSDEVGQLVHAANAMADSLRELTRQIQSVTEQVNAAAAEILASTQQQAAGTKEQAATVQEVGSTMQEIRQSGMQIVERAKEVARAAEAASAAGGSGIQAVQGTNRTMESIRQQVEEVAENIVALSEKTQAVGEIIATVNDIAEQSNLLALNAAIEAASAGDEGSRFSVVANEMKNLADQARQCTAQVRSILGDIQKGINSSVMLTEEAVKRVESGKQQADVAEGTIQEMARATEQSVQTFQQIIGATNQQQIGIEQVTQGMQDIRQAAEQTAVGTSQLEKAVSNLTSMSHQLRTAVGRYRM